MNQTLKEFMRLTATSREAMEYLQRFSSEDPEHFMLVMLGPAVLSEPKLRTSLFEALSYLIKLDLSFSLFALPSSEPHAQEELKAFFSELQKVFEQNSGRKAPSLLFNESCENLNEALSCLLLQKAFSKYLYILPENLKDEHNQQLGRVYLRQMKVNWNEKSQPHIAWITPFLERLGPQASLQVVEPDQVVVELFTKGAGTMISLGYEFNYLNSEEVDQDKLKNLLEASFGRKLHKNYFKELEQGWTVILEKEFRAATILVETHGIYYLDKIVVRPDFFGKGLGSLLFEELINRIEKISSGSPRLVWRARHDNPYLPRYNAMLRNRAHPRSLVVGTLLDNHYVYHFMGVAPEAQHSLAQFMQDRPSSFTS